MGHVQHRYMYGYVMDSSHGHKDSRSNLFDLLLFAQCHMHGKIMENCLFPFGVDSKEL